ncbi:MAG: SH3 domain-containing protein [Bdellovibrionales bacterium]
MIKALIIFVVLLLPSLAQASEKGYTTLRNDEVYMRHGPSTDHPIKWVYHKKGLPMEIRNKFDQWTKLRDINGEEGWIHNSLLSSKSYALVQSDTEKPYIVLRKKQKKDSAKIARLEDGALVRVHECEEDACKVSVSGFKGYVEKKLLWGIVQSK